MRPHRVSRLVCGGTYGLHPTAIVVGTACFYPNQRVRGTSLATDHDVAGIPCAAVREVSFHKSGRLRVATLAEDHVLNGRRFPRGTWLLFDAKRCLVRVSPAEDCEIDSVPAKSKELVEFHENGRMQRVMLARAAIRSWARPIRRERACISMRMAGSPMPILALPQRLAPRVEPSVCAGLLGCCTSVLFAQRGPRVCARKSQLGSPMLRCDTPAPARAGVAA